MTGHVVASLTVLYTYDTGQCHWDAVTCWIVPGSSHLSYVQSARPDASTYCRCKRIKPRHGHNTNGPEE